MSLASSSARTVSRVFTRLQRNRFDVQLCAQEIEQIRLGGQTPDLGRVLQENRGRGERLAHRNLKRRALFKSGGRGRAHPCHVGEQPLVNQPFIGFGPAFQMHRGLGAAHVKIHAVGDEGRGRRHEIREVEQAFAQRLFRVLPVVPVGAPQAIARTTKPPAGQGFHEPYEGRDSLPVATGGRAWSIRDVRAGTLDMATAINEMVMAEYCTFY